MKKTYKIDVSVTPNYADNKHKPYSWVLLKYSNCAWINQCFGWEATPEAAWAEAYEFYTTFKKEKELT